MKSPKKTKSAAAAAPAIRVDVHVQPNASATELAGLHDAEGSVTSTLGAARQSGTASAFSAVRRWCSDHERLSVALVLFVAAALRIVALASFSRSIYGSQLAPDEQVFDLYAREILRGGSLPTIVGFNAEVPAHVFAWAYSVWGADSQTIRALNVALGTATCGCLYLAGRWLKDHPTGLIAALIGAVYGPFVIASITAHKTALELLLIGVCTAIGTRLVTRPHALLLILFGAALGLATHVRGNALILIPVAPVAFGLAWRTREQCRPVGPKFAAYALGLAIVLAPLSTGGLLGATEHGFNLYIANTLDNPSAYFRPVRFAPAQPSLQGGGFVLKGSLEVGRTLSVAEARDYYSQKLKDEWRASPGAAFRKVLAKLAASVNVYEHAHNHNLAFISRFVAPLGWPWIGFGLLLSLAVFSLGESDTGLGRRWLALMSTGYWLTLVIFFSEIRLRAPLGLLLAPLAALGLQNIARRRGRALISAALIAAGCFLITHLPVPGAGDLTSAYNFHALLLFDAGDFDGAERYYDASRRLEGIDSQAGLSGLAAVALKRDDLATAESWLEQIDDQNYKAYEKYAQLGVVLVKRGRLDEAAEAFERAIDINPGMLQVYPILEAIYGRLGRPERGTDVSRRYRYAASFFN